MPRPIPERIIQSILTYLASEEQYVFLETSKPDHKDKHSYLFLNPVTTINCNATDDTTVFFEEAQRYLDEGFYLAGWFAYEFGSMLEPTLRPCLNVNPENNLAKLGVFTAPLVFDHNSGKFNSETPFSLKKQPRRTINACKVTNLRPSQTAAHFMNNIGRIKEYIASGDTYQVNYTLKMLFDYTGSLEDLYCTLRRNQPVAYSSYLKLGRKQILSFSPELFFKKYGNICTVRPMKGTMSRGRTLEEDRQNAVFLQQDIKNHSENIMIVDLLRNDLGRLCEMGSVDTKSMFDIETYSTLHQMTSTVEGRIRANTSLESIFKAMFPCGSVTGAPKIRTMEIIHELESEPRGIYTGGIGYISPNGDTTFSVPIRTIVLGEKKGEMGIGAGIVHDSDPVDEWQESLLKGRFLTNPRPEFELIETILWSTAQRYWLINLHLQRLCNTAQYFAFPLDATGIEQKLKTIAKGLSADKRCYRVRISCSFDGQFKISKTLCEPPAKFDLPSAEHETIREKVIFSPKPTSSSSPMIFHKTTDRKIYNDERENAIDKGYFEVLFRNEKGEVTEGSISNIMIKKGSTFYTPQASCGLLPGICREYLLNKYPQRLLEKTLTINDLQTADAIYIMNSVRGVIQVKIKDLQTITNSPN